MVALKPTPDGREELVGIGSDRIDHESTTIVPVLSDVQFRPEIAAAVARFLVMKAWKDVRPGWRAPLSLLDRTAVWITIDGFERVSPEHQRQFGKYLPRERTTWWVNVRR